MVLLLSLLWGVNTFEPKCNNSLYVIFLVLFVRKTLCVTNIWSWTINLERGKTANWFITFLWSSKILLLAVARKKNFSFFFLNVGFMRPLWYRSSNLSHFLPKIKGRGPHLLLKDRIWAEILSGVDEVVRVVSDALIFFSRTKLLRKASKLHAISS